MLDWTSVFFKHHHKSYSYSILKVVFRRKQINAIYEELNDLADSTLHVQFHSVESERSSRRRQSPHCKLCSWHNASSVFSPQPGVAVSEPVKPIQWIVLAYQFPPNMHFVQPAYSQAVQLEDDYKQFCCRHTTDSEPNFNITARNECISRKFKHTINTIKYSLQLLEQW